MKSSRAPEEVVEDPADVVDELVVVRVLQERQVVGRIRREQRDDAADEQVEGRRALRVVDGEADRSGEQEDIAEGVSGGDELGEHRELGEVQVRRDKEDPREEADAEREDERVDERRRVAPRRPPLYEDDEAGHEHRVDGDVERVAERRERDVGAGELRIAVRVDVAREEEELAGGEEPPGGPCPRPVHADAGDDRDDAREAEQVDERPVARERREEQVHEHQRARHAEVERPNSIARAHAATSSRRAGWRSKRAASFPSTSTSCSISACVLAAVIWIRKPTSSFGTSGYEASVT